jgi:hypothetical protein
MFRECSQEDFVHQEQTLEQTQDPRRDLKMLRNQMQYVLVDMSAIQVFAERIGGVYKLDSFSWTWNPWQVITVLQTLWWKSVPNPNGNGECNYWAKSFLQGTISRYLHHPLNMPTTQNLLLILHMELTEMELLVLDLRMELLKLLEFIIHMEFQKKCIDPPPSEALGLFSLITS